MATNDLGIEAQEMVAEPRPNHIVVPWHHESLESDRARCLNCALPIFLGSILERGHRFIGWTGCWNCSLDDDGF